MPSVKLFLGLLLKLPELLSLATNIETYLTMPSSSTITKPHPKPFWPAIKGLGFGGDYNPEQWPRSVWQEDVRLMKQAGVNVVSVGIFSWALLEPEEGKWDFSWLDDVLNVLHKNGIAVDLATATASPPPWLSAKYPEILPVTAEGTTISPGGRQHYRPTSPIFREYMLKLVKKMAERYGRHPAVVAWHVSNEFGCHNQYDYSEDAGKAFRKWLENKYEGDVNKLNEAWTTAFWSQHYSTFEHILPPRKAFTYVNPAQQLDWRRFSNDALVELFVLERDALRAITPDVPVTNNIMVMGYNKDKDYANWADELDFVSNDHYVTFPGLKGRDELSFSANWVSGMSRGLPWWLMESSTSGVNWQAINTPKGPGEMAWHALTHVAQGADAICYFQWRQSKGGGETWHSSMVPHAGEDSRLFRDVCALGKRLKALEGVKGSKREKAQVAILLDYPSWWTSEFDSHPTNQLSYFEEALAWYVALLDAGIRADIIPATQPRRSSGVASSPDSKSVEGQDEWSDGGYKLVIAPILHLVTPSLADRLHQYVAQGGHLVTTYFSGIINQDVQVYLGGYPGVFRDLLGIRVEELGVLPSGTAVKMDGETEGDIWCEPVDLVDKETEVLRRYESGLYPGQPAVTLRRLKHAEGGSGGGGGGAGWAAYVSTRLTKGRKELSRELAERAGVKDELPESLRGKVEMTVRRRDGDDGGKWIFYISRVEHGVDLQEAGVRGELVEASEEGQAWVLPPKGVIVVKA